MKKSFTPSKNVISQKWKNKTKQGTAVIITQSLKTCSIWISEWSPFILKRCFYHSVTILSLALQHCQVLLSCTQLYNTGVFSIEFCNFLFVPCCLINWKLESAFLLFLFTLKDEDCVFCLISIDSRPQRE